MNQIMFPRISYEGEEIKKADLENWFCGQVEKEIAARLQKIKSPKRKDQNYLLSLIKNHLHDILVCTPRLAEILTIIVDKKFPTCFRRKPKKGKMVSNKFGTSIIKAFNFKAYRQSVLLELARMLNVKSCPYCNMHYTLFAEAEDNKKGEIAKFQFDHFFGKAEYPFLSMSLYNLIPSCSLCNQGKSSIKLSLKFHPYESAICDQFHFEVDGAFALYIGDKQDRIEIKMEPDMASALELKAFQEMFNIKSLYQRHKDIVQEVFVKEYLWHYYHHEKYFSFLNMSIIDKQYFQRLWMGVYPDPKEMERRPMSKFILDISKQAKSMLAPPPSITMPPNLLSIPNSLFID